MASADIVRYCRTVERNWYCNTVNDLRICVARGFLFDANLMPNTNDTHIATATLVERAIPASRYSSRSPLAHYECCCCACKAHPQAACRVATLTDRDQGKQMHGSGAKQRGDHRLSSLLRMVVTGQNLSSIRQEDRDNQDRQPPA